MFCDTCKMEMKDSKTTMELPGKESTVQVTNIPCSVCPQCGARVVDGISLGVAQKAAQKCKDAALDFDKLSGIGLMVGKHTL